MKGLSRQSGGVVVALAAMTAASCSVARVAPHDATRSHTLELAIDSAARERMAHVSMIVDTQRRLARAEDLLEMETIGRLMAEAEQEQVTYAHLVRAELALRRERALAQTPARR